MAITTDNHLFNKNYLPEGKYDIRLITDPTHIMTNKWPKKIHFRIFKSIFVLLLLCSLASQGEPGQIVCNNANHLGWSEVEK